MSDKKSIKILLMPMVMGIIFIIQSADALAITSIVEKQGKLSVKITEKFTIPVPQGASSVAWSPDGSILGVASGFTTLTTFDNAGHQLSQLKGFGNNSYTNSLAFLNGSSQVLLAVDNNAPEKATLNIRDVTTGHIDKTFYGIAAQPFAVSSDQQYVAFLDSQTVGNKIVIYDARNWKVVSTNESNYPKDGFSSLSFFPDGKRLAAGTFMGHLYVIDTATGRKLKDFVAYDSNTDQENIKFLRESIHTLAVKPEEDFILTGGSYIRIFRINDGMQTISLANPDASVTEGQAIWDPKGRFVAFTDGKSLVFWEPKATEKNLIRYSFSGPFKKVYNVFIGKIRTMDTSSGVFLTIALSSNGKLLAVTHGESVTVFNIDDN